MPLYGPLLPAECAALSTLQFTGKTVDFERFCEAHPYRVVGPKNMPERHFATLVCAARTVVSAGPGFHVESGEFRASHAQCLRIANDADFDRQIQEAREDAGYWEKIKEPK
jgi:hypothetical protein